jgi:hypothetical protein
MRTRLAFAAAIALLLSSFACNSGSLGGATDGAGGTTGGTDGGTGGDTGKTYPVTFVCQPDGGPDCPPGEECPVVPEGPDTCGDDLGGTYGHPILPIDMARPVGCLVGLSYGDPYFGDTQIRCYCHVDPQMVLRWSCN